VSICLPVCVNMYVLLLLPLFLLYVYVVGYNFRLLHATAELSTSVACLKPRGPVVCYAVVRTYALLLCAHTLLLCAHTCMHSC